MSIKARKKKNTDITLTIALIFLITFVFVLTSCFPQSNIKANTETSVNQNLKNSSFPMSARNINETNHINVTSFSITNSSATNNSDNILLDTSNSTKYSQPDLSQFIFAIQDQITESDVIIPVSVIDFNETNSFDIPNSYNNYSSAIPIVDSFSLGTLKFITYTYGGSSIQQPDSNQLNFTFPESTNQGQLAGTDALTMGTYIIQKMDFDIVFVTPKISALGFDEMVIFAASDTTIYKGTEFGIRMDLKDGFVYGYVQEPNGNYGDVNFEMWQLMPNDGLMHHYTLVMMGSGVSFCIDDINYGYLNFPSKTNYYDLNYSILAVVHRFTDNWDSSGDNMILESFSLNQ
jgi:hypothetical protein